MRDIWILFHVAAMSAARELEVLDASIYISLNPSKIEEEDKHGIIQMWSD